MVKLSYILERNSSNIKMFCLKNKLTSYELLLEYCKQRKFIPCTEEDYNIATGNNKNEEKLERKASKPQKKRKTRASSKSKRNTRRVLGSDDNGKN